MNILKQLLQDIPVPNIVKVKQTFPNEKIEDVEVALQQELAQAGVLASIEPGARIAIAVGSRGVANIAQVTAGLVTELKKLGAEPFIVPSMGSHGGATAKGQKEVLADLGVSEENVGAPIHSTMEVVRLATLENNLPVYVDKYAAEADGIVVINRIKPHTAFRGRVESGLMKMISIGLGKQKGAEACHQLGFKYMAENVPAMAKVIMNRLPVLFGVALIENAYDRTCQIHAIPAAQIEERERELLVQAKSLMPRILFEQMDVLLIHEIGKNISGDGMDPNITGRYPTPYAQGGPTVEKIVVHNLTPETHGNANGIGTADFTNKRLVQQIDFDAMYANGLTSTVVAPTKVATTLENDQDAIKAAIKTANILDFDQVRLIYIKNTLDLAEIYISESMLAEAEHRDGLQAVGQAKEFAFDNQGYLLPWS